MTAALVIALLAASPPDSRVDTPAPRPIVAVAAPVTRPRVRYAPSWMTAAHVAALTFDGVTTLGQREGNPVVRPLIGARPGVPRMVAWGAVEVVAAEWLAWRYPRARWARVAVVVAHVGGGTWNVTGARRLR